MLKRLIIWTRIRRRNWFKQTNKIGEAFRITALNFISNVLLFFFFDTEKNRSTPRSSQAKPFYPEVVPRKASPHQDLPKIHQNYPKTSDFSFCVLLLYWNNIGILRTWEGWTANSTIIDYWQQILWQIQGNFIWREAFIIKQSIKIHPFSFLA